MELVLSSTGNYMRSKDRGQRLFYVTAFFGHKLSPFVSVTERGQPFERSSAVSYLVQV